MTSVKLRNRIEYKSNTGLENTHNISPYFWEEDIDHFPKLPGLRDRKTEKRAVKKSQSKPKCHVEFITASNKINKLKDPEPSSA